MLAYTKISDHSWKAERPVGIPGPDYDHVEIKLKRSKTGNAFLNIAAVKNGEVREACIAQDFLGANVIATRFMTVANDPMLSEAEIMDQAKRFFPSSCG